jgi:DNA-binding MarR family transcriptional regulator
MKNALPLQTFANVRRLLNRIAVQKFKTIHLGLKQAIILRHIVFEGHQTLKELSYYTLTDPGALSRLIDSLEKKGILSRKNHKNDGRISILEATPKGKEIAHKIDQIYQEIDELLQQGLDEAEKKQFFSHLQKVERFLDGNLKSNNKEQP